MAGEGEKGKQPGWFHYSGDWMGCPELRRCGKGAIGCWIDMLCILDKNVVRGVFCDAGGTPWPDDEVARCIGGDISENLQFIDELIRKQVVSRNQKGAIYSRRMVRDTEKRQMASARKRKERTKQVTQFVTHDVTRLSEEEREIENRVEPKAFYRKKEQVSPIGEVLVTSVMAIGFRDSTWRSKNLVERALFEEVERGSKPDEIVASLCRIYRWTNNGEFAPKCYEVIPRWKEPKNLWERKNAKPTGKESIGQQIEAIVQRFDEEDGGKLAPPAGTA